MMKWAQKLRDPQAGSATIEAVIGFTGFLFAIFTILGTVNFCRAQMMVSAAVDSAAKEMAQYAYFYKMSGLQKFESTLDANGAVGKNNINEIIGTVDNLYSSISGAVEQTVEDQTNVENMLSAGEFDLDALEGELSNLEESAEGIQIGVCAVTNALKDVGSDPLLYMRSVVAVIGSQGMEIAKRAIAIPMARMFVSKHFGDSTEDANAKLESLGIEGGLDAMNFNLSNIFSDEDQEDIEIVVLYKVKLFQVFDWVVLEANVSKVASCRAWLGGDDVLEVVSATNGASLGTAGSTEDSSADATGETTGEDMGETTGGNSEDPTENTSAESTGLWALSSGEILDGFEDILKGEITEDGYSSISSVLGLYYYTEDADIDGLPPRVYFYNICSSWYGPYGASLNNWTVYLKDCLSYLGANPLTNADGTTKEFDYINFFLYIPENMKTDQPEQYAALVEDIGQIENIIRLAISNSQIQGIPSSMAYSFSISVKKAGGTYAYDAQITSGGSEAGGEG